MDRGDMNEHGGHWVGGHGGQAMGGGTRREATRREATGGDRAGGHRAGGYRGRRAGLCMEHPSGGRGDEAPRPAGDQATGPGTVTSPASNCRDGSCALGKSEEAEMEAR